MRSEQETLVIIVQVMTSWSSVQIMRNEQENQEIIVQVMTSCQVFKSIKTRVIMQYIVTKINNHFKNIQQG